MLRETPTGELLIRAGLIDLLALSQARKFQEQKRISLGKALATLGLAEEAVVAATIAKGLQLELLDSAPPEVPVEAAALLSSHFCRERMVSALNVQGNALRLAMVDPLDVSTIQDVEFQAGKRAVVVVASETVLQTLLRQTYAEGQVDSLASASPEGEVETIEDSEIDLVDPTKLLKDTRMPPVVRLVNLILSGAAKEGASDIHMEPKEAYLQVRYRVDGLLREVMKVPRSQLEATISRMKIISGMDIADHRRPQDGRSRLRYEGKRIDLRVSTLPTQFGEKVVIRLLDSRRAQITMDQMGLTPANLHALQLMLTRPQGMILVTGPTGSGKSSTLYTALNWVKSPTKNIITVEDPIEYQLEGVNQVQINPKAGITFAAGLRSILRQDPNVILVGEIRDQETAGIALEAAQTGHLLLSTVHTNDAPGTISRLLDLGIEPFLIASAVIGILAQRLVRRPCPSCVVSQLPSEEAIEKAGGLTRLPADAKWVMGRGCEQCQQSGTKGRMAIHELLVVNDEIRDLISHRAPEHTIRKAARDSGMRTLFEDGIAKAAEGLTSLEEVVRVAGTDSGKVLKVHATEANLRDEPSFADTAAEPSAESPAAVEGDTKDRGASKGKETVLIVEDSKTISSVVKYFLELEGFDVLQAADGIAGLAIARREHPHVIVTDYNMPGMDGMAMVRELRADARTRGIAILVLTSEASIEKEAQALADGADDYILKPVEPKRLAARVKAVLTRSGTRVLVSGTRIAEK